ncbi:MAG TPA: HPF/RaiA family ribosome-associated protein [Gemmatimonadales bacterium]
MRITTTARHADVPPELRVRARALLERVGKVAARTHDARVIFAAEHGRSAVELQLHTVRGRVLVARAEAPDHRTALDRAAARLRRQLDKATPSRRRARPRRVR